MSKNATNELEKQRNAVITDTLTNDAMVETSGEVYERVIASAADTTREVIKQIAVNKHIEDEASGTMIRVTSAPDLSTSPYPTIPTAGEFRQPQAFRRDFVDNSSLLQADSTFMESLFAFNSQTLYAWMENELDSDSEPDEDAVVDTPSNIRQMVFRSYGPMDLRRRNSDLQNESDHLAGDSKTILTLFKCFVATGILFLPSGFKNAGLFTGVCVILISGMTSLYGIKLLLRTVEHIKNPNDGTTIPLLSDSATAAVNQALFQVKPKLINTYSKVGDIVLGRVGRRIIETSILFSQVGFCCVYISFTGKSLKDALGINHVFAEGKEWPLWLYMVLTIPIVTPLTFIRHLAFFATPNLVANVFVITSVLIILGTSISQLASGNVTTEEHPVYTNWTCTEDKIHSACMWINKSSFMMFFGTAVYAFEGITMIIPVQNSMKHPERLESMLTKVIVSVSTLFAIFGGVNFYVYGQETQPVIVANLPARTQLAVTSMFVLVAIFMFPLMIFPAARIIERRFYKAERRSGKKWQKNFIRTNIVVFCVLVGVVGGERVDKLVAVIGGAFCVPLALIYPPLLYLKSGAYRGSLEAVRSIILFVFGLFASAVATVIALSELFS